MKLIECYVENFGILSGEKISFNDGLNCIKEDNGSGKTTLATFIKVMLYGMSDTRKMSLDENDRKRYLPWHGGVCGGSLTFSAGGKTYRVERTFGSKVSDDTYILYETATGKVSLDFPDGLGEGLFGIDADGFERTVFLSERALTPKSDNKSISAKLSDLVGCDGDIGEMDKALKALEEKRKFYQKKGGTGEIADTKAKIDTITRKLEALGEVEKEAETNREKMRALRKKIDSAREEAKAILAKKEEALRYAAEVNYEKQYKDMKAVLEESERRRMAVSEIFGTEIPSHSDIDEAKYKSLKAKELVESSEDSPESVEFKALASLFDGRIEKWKIDETRSAVKSIREYKIKKQDPRLARAKKIFSGRVPEESEISEVEHLIAQKDTKITIGAIGALSVSIICALCGVFEEALLYVGLGLLLLSALLGGGLLVAASSSRNKKIKEFFLSVSGSQVDSKEEASVRLQDMRRMLEVIKELDGSENIDRANAIVDYIVSLFGNKNAVDKLAEAEAIIAKYDRYSELAVAERFLAGDRNAKIEKARQLKAEAEAFLQKYKVKTDNPFEELRSALNEYNRLTAEMVTRRAEINKMESLYAFGEGSQRKAELDVEALDNQRAENEATVSSLDREYTLTERIYSSQMDELEERDELIIRKRELEELLAEHSDNFNTVVLTKKYLDIAKDNMTSRYIGKTRAGFLKYAKKIGGIMGENFEMGTDFGITKQEGGSTKTVEAYSKGTRDLFNLAARLGLVDALYEKEKPFILLDDPFTAFDDKKTDAAIKMLKEIGKERQVIYFTCTKSRSI